MANITIKKIHHAVEGMTVIEFETDTGINTRIGMPGTITDEQEIIDHIRSDYKITQEQLENECGPTEEWLATRYRSDRVSEYPPLSDLADAMYWASKGDNTKLDNYYAACEAVKQKYPKS